MKQVFLIDYENTAWHGLDGISLLRADTKIVLFYSGTSDIRTLQDLLSAYEEKGMDISFVKLKHSGKNALDFMIAVMAGYEMHTRGKKEIFIISRDRGYRPIADEAENINPGCRVVIARTIRRALDPVEEAEPVDFAEVKLELQELGAKPAHCKMIGSLYEGAFQKQENPYELMEKMLKVVPAKMRTQEMQAVLWQLVDSLPAADHEYEEEYDPEVYDSDPDLSEIENDDLPF